MIYRYSVRRQPMPTLNGTLVPANEEANAMVQGFSIHLTTSNYVNKSHTRPWKVRFYPKRSLFRKSDLIDKGCTVFIKDCPKPYKQNLICARHYDGQYKTFNNYCEMEFENCNSWRKWSMIKRSRC